MRGCRRGGLKYREDVIEGLENAPRGFIGLLHGENFGKLVVRVSGTDMAQAQKVTWVFDVISPFSYLAFPRLTELPPHLELEYKPVLLAALLSHFGQLGPAEIPPKRRFTYRFALWRARRLGLPMRFPPAHPFNPLAALRLVIAAGCDRRATGAVLDAIFRDGRDASQPE